MLVERFLEPSKTECFYPRQFETAEELIVILKQYLEYSNRQRIQQKLKRLTPIDSRNQS